VLLSAPDALLLPLVLIPPVIIGGKTSGTYTIIDTLKTREALLLPLVL